MGILGKLFGKKKEEVQEEEAPVRLEVPKPQEEDFTGQRWKLAKRWREEKAMEEPLVKREGYKRKY